MRLEAMSYDFVIDSATTLAERQEKYLRERWGYFQEDLKFITTRTLLVSLDRSIALLAGEINYSQKKTVKDWGMADSIILATARSASAKVITGDLHFKHVQEAVLV